MHEVGLVAKGAAEMLQHASVRRIAGVTVSVGPRADRDVVEAAWELVTRNTPLEAVDVTFQDARDEMVCFSCATPYGGDALTRCPACGGDGIARELAPDLTVAER